MTSTNPPFSPFAPPHSPHPRLAASTNLYNSLNHSPASPSGTISITPFSSFFSHAPSPEKYLQPLPHPPSLPTYLPLGDSYKHEVISPCTLLHLQLRSSFSPPLHFVLSSRAGKKWYDILLIIHLYLFFLFFYVLFSSLLFFFVNEYL